MVHKRTEQQEFLNNYLYPLFGFISITTFIGAMWLNPAGNLTDALKSVMIVVASVFGGYYAASYLIGKMYLKIEQVQNDELIQQFVGYSSLIVYLLFFIMPLLPGLELLWLFAVYTFYPIYSGVTVFLNIPEKERTVFTLGSFAAITFLPLLLNFMLLMVVK